MGMNQKISYKLFTILQLSNWLLHHENNGITEKMLSSSRAYALITNPHASKEDIVLAAALDCDKVVGYTAVFPEKMIKPFSNQVFYWGTTQWL